MKIRLGFVSNSSSSSFICTLYPFGSVFNLAREMLVLRNIYWTRENNIDYSQELEKLNRAIELGVNPNTPVQFSTTNYDTYIREVTGYLHVDTCNNIDWSTLEQFTNLQYYNDDEVLSNKDSFYYWYIKEGIVGKPLTSAEWMAYRNSLGYKQPGWIKCLKSADHFGDIVRTPEGIIECVDCFKEEKKKDMIIQPSVRLKYRPIYIPRKRVKLR